MMLAAKTKRTGISHWEYGEEETPSTLRPTDSAMVTQWEREHHSSLRKLFARTAEQAQSRSRTLVLIAIAFVVGFALASGPRSTVANLELRDRLRFTRNTLLAREGELELTRLELTRLNTVMDNSRRYHIPADLAAKIFDVALAEGIDPKIAFSLVSIESDFTHNAVSPKGALGLTQLMPSTARFFQSDIVRAELFDPETNLRIGFRFLRELIAKYNGNVDLALSAYNRGPAVVDKVVSGRGDPSNGYSDLVLKGSQ